jgi:hypothetical protein
VGRIVGYGPMHSADAPTPSADNRTFFADLAGTNPFLQTSAGQAEKVGFEFRPLRQRLFQNRSPAPLNPRRKALWGAICRIDLCTSTSTGQAENILQGLFFSRPPYFRAMIRFSENHKRTVLRTRFHAPDFESRSLGRARREKDRSFIDLNLATPANH